MITLSESELKALLLAVRESEDFSLYYTGKKSRRVDAKYYFEKKEIMVNELNFDNNAELIYSSLHEYAHHIQNTESFIKDTPHDLEFWKIFHKLLYTAEEKELYSNCCHSEFREPFKRLIAANEEFNKANLKFFEAIDEFRNILGKENFNQFIDCSERLIKIPRGEVKKIIAAASRFKKGYHYNTMIRLASKKDIDETMLKELAFYLADDDGSIKKQYTFDMFKFYSDDNTFSDEIAYLQDKKEKLENSLESKQEKIQIIESRLTLLLPDDSSSE